MPMGFSAAWQVKPQQAINEKAFCEEDDEKVLKQLQYYSG